MDTRFLYRELFSIMPNGLLPNVKLLTVLKHLVQSGIMKISLIYCLLLCRSVQNLVRRGFWAEQTHLYMFLLLWCRSVENLVRRGGWVEKCSTYSKCSCMLVWGLLAWGHSLRSAHRWELKHEPHPHGCNFV